LSLEFPQQGYAMKNFGIDLTNKTTVLCVVNKEGIVLHRRRFLCGDAAGITAYFQRLGAFRFVVETTATYEWLMQLLEPLAHDWAPTHPDKMRVSTETAKKTGKAS
jgi:transposase